jgi:hypothetical protein
LTHLPEFWEKEIINIPGEVDWVLETSRQLLKDFAMLNLSLEFTPLSNQPYSTLFNEASQCIQVLYQKNYQGLLSLLYRIDLDENILHDLVNTYAPPELYDRITEWVLKRELIKVVYRYKYMG